MLIQKPEMLQTWLASYLKPRCDADPEALAKYVLALLKKEAPESELRERLLQQMEIFLSSRIYEFIHTLFAVLASKEYQNPPPKTRNANQKDGCLQSACQALETLKTEIADFKEIHIKNSTTIETLTNEKEKLESDNAALKHELEEKTKRIEEMEYSLEYKGTQLMLLEKKMLLLEEQRKEKDAEIKDLCLEVKLIANQAALLATGFEMNHLELEEIKEKIEHTFKDIETASKLIDEHSLLYRKERNALEKENIWKNKGNKFLYLKQMKDEPKNSPDGGSEYTIKDIKKIFQDKSLDMDAKITKLEMDANEPDPPRSLKRKASWVQNEDEATSTDSEKESNEEGSPGNSGSPCSRSSRSQTPRKKRSPRSKKRSPSANSKSPSPRISSIISTP